MEQQARLFSAEQKPTETARPRRRHRASRPWQMDEATRRAARKGIQDARRALAQVQSPPADAA